MIVLIIVRIVVIFNVFSSWWKWVSIMVERMSSEELIMKLFSVFFRVSQLVF